MAGNPQVAQGTLNKVRSSVIVTGDNTLNVTAPFLGRNMVSVAFQGDASAYIQTASGAVPSPEPYLVATITIDVLKTTGTLGLWRTQLENASFIGDIRVVSDTVALSDYTFTNCTIISIGDLPFDGSTAEARITINGIYYVNSSLWSL